MRADIRCSCLLARIIQMWDYNNFFTEPKLCNIYQLNRTEHEYWLNKPSNPWYYFRTYTNVRNASHNSHAKKKRRMEKEGINIFIDYVNKKRKIQKYYEFERKSYKKAHIVRMREEKNVELSETDWTVVDASYVKSMLVTVVTASLHY